MTQRALFVLILVLAPGSARSDERWWSFRPLSAPQVPHVTSPAQFPIRNAIDAFVVRRLKTEQLTPSPPADRTTLIRRLCYDLIGLPPTPEQIRRFAGDESPDAYEKLVDRLLGSPGYGERWARHWLDVVHFGESHGYDKDKPRMNAWPYRDYVIRSLNQDKPYGQFVREQVAGDILFPDTRDGIEALGFIAAGPWDFIGHAEVPETKIDGKIARHLDRDDMVQNTISTFLSLTVGCAQCHDHKFDPIKQVEYYRLHAVFAALDRADKRYYSDPHQMRRYERLADTQRTLTERKASLETEVAEQAGQQLAVIDRQLAAARSAEGKRPAEYGYHSGIEPRPNVKKWVQVDLGDAVDIDRIELIGCDDDFNGIGAGFGFPVRYRIELSTDPDFLEGVVVAVDRTNTDVLNPGTTPQLFRKVKQRARYIRLTATTLALRQNDYILAVAELRAFDRAGNNVAAGKPVTALDSIEAPVRWRRSNLVDGLHPRSGASAEQLQELADRRQELISKRVAAQTIQALEQVEQQLADCKRRLAQLPEPQEVYAATVHHGSGSFRGTGPDGGRPRPIHFLNRGDVTRPGKPVRPGALDCLEQLNARFEVSPDQPEGLRRKALAEWLTHSDNPLVWRSIANRIWLYHFGQGLVSTPNDFGRMGELPSHPELLDWLACAIRDQGSLKRVHRLIICSSTYRQTSVAASEPAPPTDLENRLLWKMNRRRMDAESIRDAILLVAGKLDREMGGPSFQDFVIEKPEHSPHYQYQLHDPDDPSSHRRSVYRFLVRSQTQPFMTVFDCADPSMRVAQRHHTISPLQALALRNNKLTLVMAKHFANRLEAEAVTGEERIRLAFQFVLGRAPDPQELAASTGYAAEHGLANACRVLLNLNEFIFVD